MSKVAQIFRVGALALTTAAVLTACGGGGDGVVATVAQTSSNTPSSPNTPSTAVTCDGICFKVGAQK